MGLTNWITGVAMLLGGIFLTAIGAGGVGVRLILAGGLSLLSLAMGSPSRAGFESSARYGFDNLSNVARDGGPVPIVYGQEVVAPQLISVNLKQIGQEQRLLMLYLLSEGEIDSVSNVQLNDTPIELFPGAQWAYRRGTSSQLAFGTVVAPGSQQNEAGMDFGQIGQAYEANTELGAGQSHTHEMHGPANEAVLSLVWPGGLYRITKEGKQSSAAAGVKIEYRVAGGSWAPVMPSMVVLAGEWDAPPAAGTFAARGNTTAALRHLIRIKLPDATSIFQIRITGNLANQDNYVVVPRITSVLEVVNDTRTYPNRALLAVAAPASSQLSGSIPRVTCKVKGIKVYDPRTATTAWSQNPILCLRDLILSTRYGLGDWLSSTDLDDGVGGTWRTAADECDADVTTPGAAAEDRHQLDLVMDVKAEAREWIARILATCRASLYASEGKIKVFRDKAGSATRDFSEDEGDGKRKNVVATPHSEFGLVSSIVERSIEDQQRWTAARIRYTDREDDYSQQVVEVKLYRAVLGAVTGGPFQMAARFTYVSAGSTKNGGYVAKRAANGDAYLYYATSPTGTVPTSSTSIKGVTSGATATVTFTADDTIRPEKAFEIQLYGVTRRTQVLREARYHLNRALLTPRLASWRAFLGDLDLEPGDQVAQYSTRLGWSGKQFTVLSVAQDHDGLMQLETREYDAAVFTDTIDEYARKAPWQPGGGVVPGMRTPAGGTGTSPTSPTGAAAQIGQPIAQVTTVTQRTTSPWGIR